MDEPLIIANCSGFYGDRVEAAAEMVEGGPIDVLTGDYLAELTMAILWRAKQRDPSRGYATTFLRQMESLLGTCLDRGIRVVANAGGLDPEALAGGLADLAGRLGLPVRIGVVTGDDVLGRLGELAAASGGDLRDADTGAALGGRAALTAHAYLGGWGITACLAAGADVVVGGRIADAALVSGPAAWHHGWGTGDWDALAGAVVAGHVLECGAQCTGGNFSFFDEIPGLEHPGFPIAEIAADGSAVITKHPGTGGTVTVETVTAQLLYEVGGHRYAAPDVVARFDTIGVEQAGADRVRVSGVVGEPAPATAKLGLNLLSGFRNTLELLVPAPAVAEKAALAERSIRRGLPEGVDLEVDLVRRDRPGAERSAEAFAALRVTASAADPESVGRRFSGRVVELALASYPGFTMAAPPGEAVPVVSFFPTLVPAELIEERALVDGAAVPVAFPTERRHLPARSLASAAAGEPAPGRPAGSAVVPLGRVAGARSGDKGGNANVGVWARSGPIWEWLRGYLTADRVADLLPEVAGCEIERHVFDNLRAVNFVVRGLLGSGAASSTRVDPQAKALGEFLRTRPVEVPLDLLESYDRSERTERQ